MAREKRTYKWTVKLPVSGKSEDCSKFKTYVEKQIRKNRELLEIEPGTDGSNCTVTFKMRCWSCGVTSANRLKRDIMTEFKEADCKELERERL